MDIEAELIPKLPVFKKPKNKYEKIEQAKKELARALLETGHPYREIAEALDISVGSVHKIAKEPREKTSTLTEAIRARFGGKHLLLADHILNRITDCDIDDASLKDKVVSAAILTDKAMQVGFDLAAGEPVRTVQLETGAFTRSEQENPDNHP